MVPHRGSLKDGCILLLVVLLQSLAVLSAHLVSVGILSLVLWRVHLVSVLWHDPRFVIQGSAVPLLH